MAPLEEVLHDVYLTFTEDQLRGHFAAVGTANWTPDQHLNYFKTSVDAYKDYLAQNPNRKGQSIEKMRRACQIEKDERFWTASCLMNVFHSQSRVRQFVDLFRKAFGNEPPFAGSTTWETCFGENLHLFFEPNLPSPQVYKKWLRQNLSRQQFIPYVLDSDNGTKNLEGATNVDAMLINDSTGFATLIEAKVLSDISHDITYDVMRNQIARNIDVMLEENGNLQWPLRKRDPEKSLFLLLTPRLFKNNPTTRLYGYKFNEYKDDPKSLQKDLPHRKDADWATVSKRLGWLTWEDFREVNPDCCKWLNLP
jgi:hypothetical protein